MGGIHALEHAAIALFPLFALCERDDVGGISTPLHAQVGKAAVFIYDGYPGGIGLSEQSFARIEELLEAALSLIEGCDCEEGCPACIHSPKCGSGNVPLDKAAAIMTLKLLLDKPEAGEWRAAVEVEPEPPDFEPERKVKPAPEPTAPRIMVFDLETRRGAQEVGGWRNAHLMGLAVAVVWDSRTNAMTAYFENDAPALFAALRAADLVVGFNIIGFDYRVLSSYDDGTLARLPAFDLLYDLKARLGYRLSLGHLAEHTLGRKKIADGLKSLEWVKQGRLDLVEEYCRKDVEITRDLFYHGLEKGRFRFLDKNSRLLELRVDWELERLIERARREK